jgi:hypothetical protein
MSPGRWPAGPLSLTLQRARAPRPCRQPAGTPCTGLERAHLQQRQPEGEADVENQHRGHKEQQDLDLRGGAWAWVERWAAGSSPGEGAHLVAPLAPAARPACARGGSGCAPPTQPQTLLRPRTWCSVAGANMRTRPSGQPGLWGRRAAQGRGQQAVPRRSPGAAGPVPSARPSLPVAATATTARLFAPPFAAPGPLPPLPAEPAPRPPPPAPRTRWGVAPPGQSARPRGATPARTRRLRGGCICARAHPPPRRAAGPRGRAGRAPAWRRRPPRAPSSRGRRGARRARGHRAMRRRARGRAARGRARAARGGV